MTVQTTRRIAIVFYNSTEQPRPLEDLNLSIICVSSIFVVERYLYTLQLSPIT